MSEASSKTPLVGGKDVRGSGKGRGGITVALFVQSSGRSFKLSSKCVEVGTKLTTPSERVEAIDTPREIAGLGIHVAGEPLTPRKGWARRACRPAVSEMLGSLDPIGIDGRLDGEPEPMADLKAFRTRFVEDKFPVDANDPAVRKALLDLPASRAIDLLAGQPIDTSAPKVGAWATGAGSNRC